jgi:hypothetical protein
MVSGALTEDGPTGRQHAPDNRYHASKRKKPAAVRDGQPPRGREQQCPGNNCPHAGQADNRDRSHRRPDKDHACYGKVDSSFEDQRLP